MSLPPSPRVRWGALAAYVGVVAAATLLQAPVAENLTFAQRVAEFLRPPLRPSALIDAIRNDVDLSRHMEDAVTSLQICLAADESIRTGKVVELQLQG